MIITREDCLNKPMQVFLHYIVEREKIRRHKEGGGQRPHTLDPVLDEWKFCNIFREDDAVTKHYLNWIAPLVYGEHSMDYTDDQLCRLVMSTQLYRTINWPRTLNAIGHVPSSPDHRWADSTVEIERKLHAEGHKTFTGAYLISQCGRLGDPKIRVVVDSVLELEARKDMWLPELRKNSLEAAWTWLRHHVSINGPFTAYEIVTDLSYNVLKNADDMMTWANAGPGALRGINRLCGRQIKYPMKPVVACEELRRIMEIMRDAYQRQAKATRNKEQKEFWLNSAGRVNMRTAEHTMCEYDKYCRVVTGDGFPRSKYHPAKGGHHEW